MINVNLDLNAQAELFFNNSEKDICLSKDKLISTVVNNGFNKETTEEMDDLVLLAIMADFKKNNPDAKAYTHKEVGALLCFI
ncbi:MAG: hypothetical protein AM1032_000392 [Mycoplasmataceae bacterium]|nr:MAG: hypothetical protein AM1032_000392 [Mycoplasmataceae bacterium]